MSSDSLSGSEGGWLTDVGDNVLAPSAFEPGPHWSWGGLSQGLSRTMVLGSGYFYPTQDSFTKQTCLRAHCLVGREDVKSALSQSNGPPIQSCCFPFPFKATSSSHSVPALASHRVRQTRLMLLSTHPQGVLLWPPRPCKSYHLRKEGRKREEGGGRRSTVG